MANKVYTKFINGLTERGLSMYDIQDNWKYCGGDKAGRHLNYYKLNFPDDSLRDLPEWTNECVCGHRIQENCYLTNGKNDFIVLGNCCVKRFVPKSGRTCECCGAPHRSRKDNKCKTCRASPTK